MLKIAVMCFVLTDTAWQVDASGVVRVWRSLGSF